MSGLVGDEDRAVRNDARFDAGLPGRGESQTHQTKPPEAATAAAGSKISNRLPRRRYQQQTSAEGTDCCSGGPDLAQSRNPVDESRKASCTGRE